MEYQYQPGMKKIFFLKTPGYPTALTALTLMSLEIFPKKIEYICIFWEGKY
jgi:hypothetical protein